MKGGFLEFHPDGRQTADLLIETIQRANELTVSVVSDVQLQTEAQTMRFERGLPKTFDGENGFRGFASSGAGSLPVKEEWQGSVALGPHAINGLVIGGNLALEMRANGSDVEIQSGRGDFDRTGFNGEDALVETVERSVVGAIGGLREMQDQVELCFSSLQRSCVIAGQRSGRLRGKNGWQSGRC